MEGEANFTGNSAQDTILAVKEAKAWIEAVMGKKLPYGNFRQSLESGVVLCEFMEKLRPNSITKVNHRNSAIAHLDNIRQFLLACEMYFVLRGGQLFEITDLQDVSTRKGSSTGGVRRREADRRIRNVCVTLYWLGRALSNKDDYAGPQLCLEAFESMMSGDDVFGSDEFYEGLQEVTVHMYTSNGGFGFQIVGGHDCSVPATVDRVVVGGAAESRGLQPNDIIASLNGQDVTQLSHLELIRLIKQSGSKGSIVLGLLRRASFKEFSPLSDANDTASNDSPIPSNNVDKRSSQSSHDNLDRRMSEEHIAKSEILVNAVQKPNKVYVGDSSGEDSDDQKGQTVNRKWQGSSLHSWKGTNQAEEQSTEKQLKDQELRRRQQEEMAQIYPTKYSWANGKNESKFERSSVSRGGSSSSTNDGPKVFDMYGGNLDDSPIGARVDQAKQLQLENEMKHVSYATSHLRQKWRKEENRAASLSPVLARKQPNVASAVQKQRKGSADSQSDEALAALEEQLKQLQMEAKSAREEAEALKRAKAGDEARIRHEEQIKYQEELKRHSLDAQKLLSELQQQQKELNKQMELNKQQQQSLKKVNANDASKEHVEIRRQLEEQRKAIVDQWQQLDKERQSMEEKRHVIRLEVEQKRQQERQKEIEQQKELEWLQAAEAKKEQELKKLQEKDEEQKRDSWKLLSEITQLSPEVEQRRELERRAEMQRQMERLQKKEKHKSPSYSSYNQTSPNGSFTQSNTLPTSSSVTTAAVTSTAIHVTKPVVSSSHSHEFCASCAAPLGSERAMSISNLGLLYHLKCFVCCVCHAPLATGLERTQVLIRNSRPHCKFCYSTDNGLLATEC